MKGKIRNDIHLSPLFLQWHVAHTFKWASFSLLHVAKGESYVLPAHLIILSPAEMQKPNCCWVNLIYNWADHTGQQSPQLRNWDILQKNWIVQQISFTRDIHWGLSFEVTICLLRLLSGAIIISKQMLWPKNLGKYFHIRSQWSLHIILFIHLHRCIHLLHCKPHEDHGFSIPNIWSMTGAW